MHLGSSAAHLQLKHNRDTAAATLSPTGLRVAVLELKLPPFTQLDACPDVQIKLLKLARRSTLTRLRPHSIRFVGIGEHPADQNADDSKGLAAGLAVYELPRACLASHIANLPQQTLGVSSTVRLPSVCAMKIVVTGSAFLLLSNPVMHAREVLHADTERNARSL